jgi:colanic acid/amylovoran biosynthesis glycosyltransferase
MSCGVPIVGYANEAFMGIVEQSKAGWLVGNESTQIASEESRRAKSQERGDKSDVV